MNGNVHAKHLLVSCFFHLLILLGFIVSIHLSTPLPVFENTHQQDVISAVVLGDIAKSRILPKDPVKITATMTAPKPIEMKSTAKAEIKPKVQETTKKNESIISNKALLDEQNKEILALKVMQKKKLAAEKAAKLKQQQALLQKELLSDLKKQEQKNKKNKQQAIEQQLEKNVKETKEQTLRQQLLNEDVKLRATVARNAQGEINKYKSLILQAISEVWIVPSQANKKLSCELLIRLAPGGAVLDVQVTKSSGDKALDRSAQAAVLKASPLPVPKEQAAFSSFKQFALKVKPENIMVQ